MTTRLLVLLALALASAAASAQTGSVFLREAVLDIEASSGASVAGLESAVVRSGEDRRVYLGAVLLTLSAGDVVSVGVEPDPFVVGGPARYNLTVDLADPAAEAFGELTEARAGKALAIVFDGEVLSAPRINSAIWGGSFQILSGGLEEARALAAAIRRATGAVTPEAAVREALAAFRAGIDTSTPEATAGTVLGAVEAGDVLTLARLLHPAALAVLRVEEEEGLDLRDSTFTIPTPGGVERVPVSVVLERTDGAPYSDADIATMALVQALARGPAREVDPEQDELRLLPEIVRVLSLQANTVVATVLRSPTAAYAVLESPEEAGFAEAGLSYASMLSIRQVDGAWRLLLPFRP